MVIDRLGTNNKTLNQQANWTLLLKSFVSRVIIYSVWIFAVAIIFSTIVSPFLSKFFGDNLLFRSIMLLITLAVMAPFIWALLRVKDKMGIFDKIWDDQKFARGPLLFMMGIKYFIAIIAVSYIISAYITAPLGFVILIVAAVIVTVFLSKKLNVYYKMIENRFLSNLNSEGGKSPFAIPRDIASEMHMERCEIAPTSYLVGKTIREIHREKDTGAIVIQIERGNLIINLPANEETLYPSDNVMLLGSDKQIKSFTALAQDDPSFVNPTDKEEDIEMKLFQISPDSKSTVIGHDANITSFRNKFGLLIIGVEKADSDEFLRPNSSVIIEANDTIWVVGDKEKVMALKEELS